MLPGSASCQRVEGLDAAGSRADAVHVERPVATRMPGWAIHLSSASGCGRMRRPSPMRCATTW